MNRLLGGVIRISNTVDWALQTYFHQNFQFGTLWRSSRRENRFDDIRCEVRCVHCAFICFNWSSVGRGSKIAVTRSFNHQGTSPRCSARQSCRRRRSWPGRSSGMAECVATSIQYSSIAALVSEADLWFQRWLPSGEKRGGRASCDCSSARGASSARDVPFVSPFESNASMRTHLG